MGRILPLGVEVMIPNRLESSPPCPTFKPELIRGVGMVVFPPLK